MLNHEIFAKNPLDYRLPNDGVASGTEPTKEEEWEVLRQELQNFICDGEYRSGFEKILRAFLESFDNAKDGSQQKAVWVSGFYGSGKSHFVRVLKFLWANNPLPGGAEPRSLVPDLPNDVRDLFIELSNRAKPCGGLWSAIGTLGKGAKDSPRLAFLGIAFAAAKLPTAYPAAKFVLWLRRNGWEESVRSTVADAGKDWHKELLELYASPVIAEAVLKVFPDFAETPAKAREALREQFPKPNDISDDELVATLEEVLGGESKVPGQLPLCLLVVDELQQYISEDAARMLNVQEVVESCSKRFGSRLMIVATGQSAMGGGNELLNKLKGRFTLPVELSDADALRVVREVVLRKREDKKEDIASAMENRAGEIDRHLVGSKLAADPNDRPFWVADYPILPARRRFWETALRAVDRSGGAAQLRTQLKTVHDAIRAYAERPLGHVVGADVLYDQLRSEMVQNGALQSDTDTTIAEHERDSTPEAKLRARLLKATFLVNQIASDYGLRATPDVLGDLLVEDLAGATVLRQQIPGALAALAQKGQLLEVEGEYRVQTREGAAWNAEFRALESRIKGEPGRLGSDRSTELKAAFGKAAGTPYLMHGEAKIRRDLQFHFGGEAPEVGTGIPVWVRDGWNTTEKTARDEAVALGMDSPVVHVFLPSRETDALKDALASLAAASEVLDTRPIPTTREGEEAKAGMESVRANARRRVDNLLSQILREAQVFLSGGGDATGTGLRETLLNAANSALVRLFPRFNKGDHKSWSDAAKRVREGAGDALRKVGHDSEPDKHAVCAAVLTYVGAGKKGSEVRKHFAAPPYGWPQDAVDAALLVLTATEHLSASRNGAATVASKIDGTAVNQTEFKRENVTLTLGQKVALKGLLNSMGIAVAGDDLANACAQLVSKMETLASQAGGPPPSPASPAITHLDELKASSGNALSLAIWEKRDELAQQWKDWSQRATQIQARRQRWNDLENLLHHAFDLPDGKAVAEQRNAMKENRSLLDDPDPVPPLCLQLVEALRKTQCDLRDGFNVALERELTRLQNHAVWKKLAPERAQSLLEERDLVSIPPLQLGTEAEVLSAITKTNVALWRARITSLPGAVDAVLNEAMRELAPKAVKVHLPGAELHDEADVEDYLVRVRQEIMKHISDGTPVVV